PSIPSDVGSPLAAVSLSRWADFADRSIKTEIRSHTAPKAQSIPALWAARVPDGAFFALGNAPGNRAPDGHGLKARPIFLVSLTCYSVFIRIRQNHRYPRTMASVRVKFC